MSRKTTDEFLREVAEQERQRKAKELEESEAKARLQEKPNPLGEEKLRAVQPSFHSDQPSIQTYHSWLAVKKVPFCQFCSWKHPDGDGLIVGKSQEKTPENGGFFETPGRPLVGPDSTPRLTWDGETNNHTPFSGFPGADKIGYVQRSLLDLRRRGFSNLELVGFLRGLGFVNKAEDYVRGLDAVESFERAKLKWSQAPTNVGDTEPKAGR